MCLWCAVPVRGVAYGPECLGRALGDEPREESERPRPSGPILLVAAFVVALASTVLPWTSFGEGSGIFGAWSLSPRWALVAAIGSVAGVLVALVRLRRPGPQRRLDVALAVLAAAVALGAVLEWFRPPFPSRPSAVPWLAALAGTFALVAAVKSLLDERRVVS
jgi:membrane associated rhomboid family serine protease